MIKVKKLLGDEARQKLKEGIDIIANFTKITLGPKGRNVAFNKIGPLATRVINDGVTIADEIKDDDELVQAGIEMVQEICKKTNNNAGDGTSQTALLAQVLIEEGQKRMLAGINPINVKMELESDLKRLLGKFDQFSHKVKGSNDIRNIATISGNNDPEIGDAIAKIVDDVGLSASIIIEKGSEDKIRTESVKGMYFDKGYIQPAFINNLDKMIAEYSKPNIFLVKDKFRYLDDIEGFFETVMEYNKKTPMKNVVIIAQEIEGAALAALCATNKEMVAKGEGINILGIQAPYSYSEPDQNDAFDDIATVIGAQILGQDHEYNFNTLPADKIDEVKGSCDRIVANSKTSTIIGGSGDQVTKHIATLKQNINELDPNEKVTREKLEQRVDMLTSGVGIVYAGGNTEIEIKDRTLRLEDAVLASKSAVREGFVAGGGYTYLKLAKTAQSDIFKKALLSVTRQVAENAGQIPDVVVDECLKRDVGWNAKTDKYEDMVKAGVIDATLVLKNALANAVSLAIMFLTTEGLAVEYDDKKELNFR